MHKLAVSILGLFSSFCFIETALAKDVLVSSPDGAVTVAVGVKANKPYYTVKYEDKEAGGDRWFIGSITNEQARRLDLPLDFLDAGKTYRATIYEDGPDADYETNPYPMTIRQIEVTSESTLHLNLARSGGAAVRIEI